MNLKAPFNYDIVNKRWKNPDILGDSNELQWQYKKIVDHMYRSAGSGGFFNQYQTALTQFDKFQRSPLPQNSEHSGLFFMSRPKLNLMSGALRQSAKMLALDTFNITDVQFAIRCLLDTKFCNKESLSKASLSPLLNTLSPWNVPICNRLVSVSGWPDIVLETNTTEGGFHSENQTFIIGGDNLNKTYDLTLTFKDIQGGAIAAIHDFWLEYVRCVTKGIMIAYKDDIDAQRMNYTVSMYRFMLDPTRKYITKYAKATGCFPINIPLGGMFNINEGEVTVQTAGKFSIQYKVNKVEYNNPMILEDFNTLARRYCSEIDNYKPLNFDAMNNFRGLPFIDVSSNAKEMMIQYRVPPENITKNGDYRS